MALKQTISKTNR